MPHYELLLFFLVIAFVYASVGFGGGSSYLSLLTFYALPFPEMKLIALVCNIIVVTGGAILFVRSGQVNWKKIIPLIALSVPLAYAGASMKLKEDTFFIALGVSLIVSALLLWIKMPATAEVPIQKPNTPRDLATGGAIGFLSGMVGIGGGIFLSPILNLAKWDTPKKIAATASFFILVNSVAGIAGQLSTLPTGINYVRIGLLCITVFVGGQLGSRMGVNKFNQLMVRRITAIVVFVAGLEAIVKHLH